MNFIQMKNLKTIHKPARTHNAVGIHLILEPFHHHKIGTAFTPHFEFSFDLGGCMLNNQIAVILATASQQLLHCRHCFFCRSSVLLINQQASQADAVSCMGLQRVIQVGFRKNGFSKCQCLLA